MPSFFDKFKNVITGKRESEIEIDDEYVELEADIEKKEKAKVLIKLYTLEEFDDIKPILDSVREGYTISVINITPLKEKDMVTLKRAVDKLKKTIEANEGDIAGITENLLIVTPSFARVHRGVQKPSDAPKLPSIEDPTASGTETYE